ncbi:cadherin-like domain-containing protein, partial [Methylobacterium segetis]|uniref:cadherin-like domain-containing protein n=1 Tax=Methylobacterium segetis TaxID=2488750 RepID=UPI001404AE2C
TVSDGHGGSVEQVARFELAAVNDAPVLARPVALPAGAEDAIRILTAAELLAGASDADGDALQVGGLRVVEGGGTIEDLGDRRYAYRPDENAHGAVTLAYTISDGHGGSVEQ